MAGRQIAITKSVKALPVSSLMKEPYVQNETAIKPIKTSLDTMKTPYNRTIGQREVSDFNLYARPSSLKRK